MTALKELQESFQRAIVEGDDAVLAKIIDSPREKREVLLGVYQNAYMLRLTEVLMADYEQLHAFLGDEQFGEMAREYISAHPSQTPNARWFGARLAQFLGENEKYAALPVLKDLAALEQLLNDVFDSQDAPKLTQNDLAKIPQQDWASLIFTPHPATRRSDLTTNAAEIWKALKSEETPPEPIRVGETVQLIAYRPEYISMFRPMVSEEAMMWDEIAKGVPFGELCTLIAFCGGEEEAPMRAAGYLKNWISTGLLAAPDA
jgi:putative DNA-binding protein